MMLSRYIPEPLKPLAGWLAPRAHGIFARQVLRRQAVMTTVPVQHLGEQDQEIFCGYYDISPFAPGGNHLFALRVPLGADPMLEDAEVGLFDLDQEAPQFRPLTTTKLWCWQQGARLRWLADKQGNLLFNDMADGAYGARVVDISTGKTTAEHKAPLYDFSPDGATGLSLNFSRLQRLRPGYGYARRPDNTANAPAPEDDGFNIIDLKKGDVIFTYSLAEAATFAPQASMAASEHYFNHLQWSPDGTRFLAFHLWQNQAGRRFIRLLIFNSAGELVFHIPEQDHVSHYCWLDASRLLVFARLPGDATHGYRLVDIDAGSWLSVADNVLIVDGHPGYRPGSKTLILSDTYPDRWSYRHLYTYDTGRDRKCTLARFYSPLGLAGERRCDLHPRWSPDGHRVAVDTAHLGRRSIALLKYEDD